ncbi:thiamine diphosphokinase [Maliponia aquimaris]|uniref:Thiamine diphosphokinase n=1 Tax=Maliponia aquimaris TaxID=1673631 RepID=A0A238KMS8_9RHOB|nr:thiamine diphosphokinase [Maliponia aquimaris]SMX43356.1 Thiamin pyrophosphokinase, catalytic domain [Maliponia aquimaris]
MNSKIVQSDAPVLLVGGGAAEPAVLAAAVRAAETVVAADGGAARVLALGRMPDAVYGDMDSLAPEIQERLAPGVLRPVDEQDSTDFDKCLRHIAAPVVLGHGFLGDRLDHQLAAMTVLCLRPERRCVLVGAEDVVMLCPPEIALALAPGTRLSLFPMGPVTARSQGLRWPLDGLAFRPAGVIGTSNEVTGPLRLWMDAPVMLLILPVACLSELLAALAAAPGAWPARAG